MDGKWQPTKCQIQHLLISPGTLAMLAAPLASGQHFEALFSLCASPYEANDRMWMLDMVSDIHFPKDIRCLFFMLTSQAKSACQGPTAPPIEYPPRIWHI